MGMMKHLCACLLWLLVCGGIAACSSQPPQPVPALQLDPARVAVAGLSSGAWMATQSQLAWPETISGAALVAGGPWGCAKGELARALSTCMQGEPAIDVATLVDRARDYVAAGKLGDLQALAGQPVYVLHGQQDQTVAEAVSRAAVAFYDGLSGALGMAGDVKVTWDGARPFGHNLPVRARGEDCAASQPPFLGHCGFDAAGRIFAQLFGPSDADAAASATGQLLAFDQHAVSAGAFDAFLADTGYLYLPPDCQAGQSCGLLVVFHGCQQNAAAIGTAFVAGAGFNRWADAYDVAVLYPQTRASYMPLNPKACWDWWGYSGSDYDTRDGVQQRWLRRAMVTLGLPAAQP